MKHIILPALVSVALAMPLMAQDQDRPSAHMFGTGDYTIIENVHPARSFTSIADAMKRLPQLPAVEQIITPTAKRDAAAGIYSPYERAIEQTMLGCMNENATITARINAARQKKAQRGQQVMQQYNRNVEAGLMPSQQEMMQILMSSGIDLEKANEQQIMDVVCTEIAKKWGVSKDECMKILNLAQRNPNQAETYMKTNHPDLYQRLNAVNGGSQVQNDIDDPRDGHFAHIYEELEGQQERLIEVVGNYQNESERVSRAAKSAQAGDNDDSRFSQSAIAGDNVVQLAEQLYKEWLNSPEAKQIDDIENALWKRVAEWESGLTANEAYPEWWTKERKKENALIDAWNRTAAKRWIELTGKCQQQMKEIFTKVAELETENENLSKQGDTENVMYLMNKQRLLQFYNQLQQIMLPYRDALLFPCVEQQEESGTTHFGKG